MKRILILGGAGFIGSRTAKKFESLKYKVLVIDNLSTGNRNNLDNEINFIKGDIGNKKLLNRVFSNFQPDFVFNFAFNVLVPKSIENPNLEIKSIKDHLLVLEFCKKSKTKKIVFPSTGFVYGNIHKNKKILETDKISIENPYSIAKYTAEKFTEYYSKKFDLNYTIFRYGAIYGPGQITGAMSDYIRCAKKDIPCKFWGKSKTRDYVYIDDVINLNLKSLNSKSSNKIFNVGSGIETNLPKLYLNICKILNTKPKPIFLKEKFGEQINYKLNSKYVFKTLNWKPKTKLNEGLLKTIKFHLVNKL